MVLNVSATSWVLSFASLGGGAAPSPPPPSSTRKSAVILPKPLNNLFKPNVFLSVAWLFSHRAAIVPCLLFSFGMPALT